MRYTTFFTALVLPCALAVNLNVFDDQLKNDLVAMQKEQDAFFPTVAILFDGDGALTTQQTYRITDMIDSLRQLKTRVKDSIFAVKGKLDIYENEKEEALKRISESLAEAQQLIAKQKQKIDARKVDTNSEQSKKFNIAINKAQSNYEQDVKAEEDRYKKLVESLKDEEKKLPGLREKLIAGKASETEPVKAIRGDYFNFYRKALSKLSTHDEKIKHEENQRNSIASTNAEKDRVRKSIDAQKLSMDNRREALKKEHSHAEDTYATQTASIEEKYKPLKDATARLKAFAAGEVFKKTEKAHTAKLAEIKQAFENEEKNIIEEYEKPSREEMDNFERTLNGINDARGKEVAAIKADFKAVSEALTKGLSEATFEIIKLDRFISYYEARIEEEA